MTIPHFAVIPTRGRPDDLLRCIKSIRHQVDRIVIVDNNDDPYEVNDLLAAEGFFEDVIIFYHAQQPPNLSKLWNLGLETTEFYNGGGEAWNVAILNDDAIVPPGWFQALSQAMRVHNCAAACQQPFGGKEKTIWVDLPSVKTVTPGVESRLTGWAFMLRGELGLRFDEQFQWWCGDDDMSMQARRHGGLIQVPGFPVQNVHANESTVGALLDQSAIDMQRFVDKWGVRPW